MCIGIVSIASEARSHVPVQLPLWSATGLAVPYRRSGSIQRKQSAASGSRSGSCHHAGFPQLGAKNSSEICTGISCMTALPACASTARKSATWPATTKYTAIRVLGGGISAASPACQHVVNLVIAKERQKGRTGPSLQVGSRLGLGSWLD